MTELKPCPFCGGEDLEIDHAPTYDVRHPDVYEVHCVECGGRGGEGWTEAEAIAAWNTRAEMGYEDTLILLDELGLSERTCHIVPAMRKYTLSDGTEAYEDGCSECGEYVSESDNYCPGCGAKVVD